MQNAAGLTGLHIVILKYFLKWKNEESDTSTGAVNYSHRTKSFTQLNKI